ncbi:hypothetical protein [Siccirubricoccus sp. G192]|nr:hypothetical protein [Siccirubricoccus sp. G192]MBV1797137.1 hypothetical protein [Siccirubricoccus sp. G192]
MLLGPERLRERDAAVMATVVRALDAPPEWRPAPLSVLVTARTALRRG